MMSVAVLCVDNHSIYKRLDCLWYDADKDAMTFSGGCPVVCHPPCRQFSVYCRHQAKIVPGEMELALWCVDVLRCNGGILEHPARSLLFQECGIPEPPFYGSGVITLQVNQSWWGGPVVKRTWLAFFHIGLDDIVLPFGLRDPRGDRAKWNRLSRRKRAATPPAMAAWLLDTASKARPHDAG